MGGADVSLNDDMADQTDSAGKHTFQLSKILHQVSRSDHCFKECNGNFSEEILSLQPCDDFQRVYLKRIALPTPTPDRPAEVTRFYSSGAKISGAMKAFSDWYTLCSAPEAGYEIRSADFKLSGDRVCNAWSECQQVSLTPMQVCWRFRLQGHDE